MSNTIAIPPGALDWALKQYREPGTHFALERGEYTTRGCFGFPETDLCMLAPGCSLSGDPQGGTVIAVVDPVTMHRNQSTRYYEAFTGGSRLDGSGSTSISISDVHLQLPDRGIPVVGVHVWSSQARIRNVIVSGVFGNRAHEGPAKEGFGILINNGSGSRFDGGHLVEGCRVHMAFRDGENYSTGIFVGSVLQAGVTMYYSTVRSCSVGIDTGAVGHAAYAANAMTRILDSEAHHVVRAFFCDTGPVECVEIDGMRAHDIDWAVDMRVAIAGQHRRHFAVRNSRFFFRPRPQGMSQAMLLADETGNPATEICAVELSDCTFVAPSQREASKGRCRGKVDRIAERRCRWIGDWRDPVLQEGAVPWEVVA